MPPDTNGKNSKDIAEQLKRIADNLYRISEQLGELNVQTVRLDVTLQETRNILDHLKTRKFWLFWRQ